MLGSFRPTKWTLLPSFLFRILFLAWVNLKTKNLNCGPVAHGSGRQFRVTEAVWQEPTETVNGKAPEVLGFTVFLRVVSTFPHNLTSGIWSLALTTLERRDPEREDNDRLLAHLLVEVIQRHVCPGAHPFCERCVCHEGCRFNSNKTRHLQVDGEDRRPLSRTTTSGRARFITFSACIFLVTNWSSIFRLVVLPTQSSSFASASTASSRQTRAASCL